MLFLLTKEALENHTFIKNPSLKQVLEADKIARDFVKSKIGKIYANRY